MPALIFAFLLILFAAPLAADDAVDFKQQRITIAMLTEPPNLNSMLATDQIGSFVLAHVMEGLLQYGQNGKLAPGVAERWELRPDGATFWLRRDARWSDGKPVTAQDFVFAWRTAVEPATASQYASALFPISNAERVNAGKLPSNQLGVRAIGTHRLEVQFERPCPYFLGLTATMTLYPIREDFYRERGERYAADASDLLYNGAFTLSRWVHGAHLTFERNEMYWGRQNIQLKTIDAPYFTADSGAQFNLFKSGNIAFANEIERDAVQEGVDRGLPVKILHTASMYYWEFNFRSGRITSNKSFRQAIQALFDPQLLVDKIVGMPGVRAADSLFPRIFEFEGKAFIDAYPVEPPRRNLLLARQYLEQACKELGLKQFPPIVLLVSDRTRAQATSEYFQQLLSAGLGLDVRIDRQVFKHRISKLMNGEFDIAGAEWGPDYNDPLTFGDLLASWNDNNRGRYHSEEYDRWVAVAQGESDQQKRLNAFAQMQRLVIEDVPLIFNYESAIAYVQHSQLQGVNRNVFGGDPSFKYARVVEEKVR